MPIPPRPIAILAYGSLLNDPGPQLAPLIVGREPCETPFPVEYGRASRRWNDGPVLVPHPDGAAVAGALLLLSPGLPLGVAVDLLAEREGLLSARGVVEVPMGGGRMVLAASLPRNLPRPDMRPRALARRAAASVPRGERNGVAYLRRALGNGIRTPRTDAYAEEVLALAGAASLEDAERRLLALPRTAGGGVDGLG